MHPQFCRRCHCGAIVPDKQSCTRCAALGGAAAVMRGDDVEKAVRLDVQPLATLPFIAFPPMHIAAGGTANIRTQSCLCVALTALIVASDEPVLLCSVQTGTRRMDLGLLGGGLPVPAPYAVLDLPVTHDIAAGCTLTLSVQAERATTVRAAFTCREVM